MNAGPSGFSKYALIIIYALESLGKPSPELSVLGGAPISKVLVLATISSSVAIQLAKASSRRTPLLVKFLTKYFAFKHPGELLFGASLCYYFRIFERRLGSSRYGSFAMVTCATSFIFEGILFRFLGKESATGPYALIFASLIPFILDVPHLHSFSVLGLRMTDKAFIYLASLQLFFASAPKSLVAGACGFLTGLLYRFNFLGLKKLHPPAVVRDLFGSLGRLINGPLISRNGWYIFHSPVTGGRQDTTSSRAGPSASAASVPPREAVGQLVAMGFNEERAIDALIRSGNNVEMALQHLL